MAVLKCDVCDGTLKMDAGGKTATCTICGVQYPRERLQEKIQEIRGGVKIESPIDVRGTVEVIGVETKKSLYEKAEAYTKLEDTNSAIKTYEEIVNKYPSDSAAWWKLFTVYLDVVEKLLTECLSIDYREISYDVLKKMPSVMVRHWLRCAEKCGENATKLSSDYSKQYKVLIGRININIFQTILKCTCFVPEYVKAEQFLQTAIKADEQYLQEYNEMWSSAINELSQFKIGDFNEGHPFSIDINNYLLLNFNYSEKPLATARIRLWNNYRRLFVEGKTSFFTPPLDYFVFLKTYKELGMSDDERMNRQEGIRKLQKYYNQGEAIHLLQQIVAEGKLKVQGMSGRYKYKKISFLRNHLKYLGKVFDFDNAFNWMRFEEFQQDVYTFPWNDSFMIHFWFGGTIIVSWQLNESSQYILICDKPVDDIIKEEARCPFCWGLIKKGMFGMKCSYCGKSYDES